MKITELDLQAEGKKYKYYNTIFTVKDGDLVDIESNTYLRKEDISITELLEMDFEEIKEMKNPYERVDRKDTYYVVNEQRGVGSFKDSNDYIDNKRFNGLNYFNNRNYAEYVALKENLMRRMDKFAWEHNAKVSNWDVSSGPVYYIGLDRCDKKLAVCGAHMFRASDIYFTSQGIAEQAIEEFKDDLMKLYTWEFDF